MLAKGLGRVTPLTRSGTPEFQSTLGRHPNLIETKPSSQHVQAHLLDYLIDRVDPGHGTLESKMLSTACVFWGCMRYTLYCIVAVYHKVVEIQIGSGNHFGRFQVIPSPSAG